MLTGLLVCLNARVLIWISQRLEDPIKRIPNTRIKMERIQRFNVSTLVGI